MKKALSTLDIAELLGVAVGSVSNWIDQNLLKAGRTPGGHRRVLARDLIEFLHKQNLPIPPELLPDHPTVLVVDDEEPVTKWVAEVVQAEYPDCEVLRAHDGFSAGELVASSKPVAVILDLQMPGMDGYEVCRRIKSKEQTRGIVVIAITAHYSLEVEKRIVDCGAKTCLPKPLDLAVLMNELALALGREGRAKPSRS
ncbi:MAG: response regulator [Phycisphaerae bacterium]|jgi:excisionase family DNA binding protein